MARIEVPMPQMGESIAEGTVSKWMKQVGDTVECDEPILEISTDKVDAEIPSPSSGTLVEIVVQEGETVEVGTIVAYVDTEAGAGATPSAPVVAVPDVAAPVAPVATSDAAVAPASSGAGASAASGPESVEERLRTRSTRP